MPTSRRRCRSQSPCVPVCDEICPRTELNTFQRYFRNFKIVSIIVLCTAMGLIVGDHYFNVQRRDFYVLKDHIHHIEKNLHNVMSKKGTIEKQLNVIVSSLPTLKNMANNLRNDVKQCNNKPVFRGKDEKLAEKVRLVIREELEQYNADKTGRTDFALESSGGSILNTRKTESFSGNSPSLSLFGIPLCHSSNNPRALIQPGVMPGECWAFKGSSGAAVIQLITKIQVTGISVEHIARSISPTGETNTAPKEFSIWGLQAASDKEGFFFGQFEYNIDGTTVQYFPVLHQSSRTFDIIEFKVHSNHGHREYTCIYRLRIHGDLKER